MVVNRMWKGVHVAGQEVRRDLDRRAAAGSRAATKVRVRWPATTARPGAGGERVLNATDVILATGLAGQEPARHRARRRRGSSPRDDVLRMDTMPASVIVIGAGAVGVEFASMYHDLGAQVTLLEYLPAIVPLEDRDVSKELERSFNRRGIKVITNARFDAASVKAGDDGVRITVGPEGKDATDAPRGDAARRRGPRPQRRGRRASRSTTAELDRGIVKVDGHMRTREPHLYAIGDIVGGLMLAHTAAHEGITAVHTIVGDPDVHGMDYVKQPRATYCRPEIASVGLTEQQCEKREPADQDRPRCRSRPSARRSSAASTRASPRSSRTRRPTRRWASTSSARMPRTSSRRRASRSRLEARRGRSASRPTRTRRCPEILGETAMAVDGRLDQLLDARTGTASGPAGRRTR